MDASVEPMQWGEPALRNRVTQTWVRWPPATRVSYAIKPRVDQVGALAGRARVVIRPSWKTRTTEPPAVDCPYTMALPLGDHAPELRPMGMGAFRSFCNPLPSGSTV
jgi:hypothetical protein